MGFGIGFLLDYWSPRVSIVRVSVILNVATSMELSVQLPYSNNVLIPRRRTLATLSLYSSINCRMGSSGCHWSRLAANQKMAPTGSKNGPFSGGCTKIP